MEFLYLCVVILFLLPLCGVPLFRLYHRQRNQRYPKLPPGRTGWPLVGESLEFFSCGLKGEPGKFVVDRLAKYAPHKVFKTSILGEKMIVLCGAAGNKFLYSNENKLVQSWWPKSVQKIFASDTSHQEQAKKLRKLLPTFLKPEPLQRYIPIMDHIARLHFAAKWDGEEQVEVFPLAKHFTFWLACRLFLSIEDPTQVANFAKPFNEITSGIMAIPIDLPGTPFNRGIKASKLIRKEIKAIIKQRKLELGEGKASSTQDILSHMLLTSDEDGNYMSESDIADKILGLLVGGHDTASSVSALVVKYLAELPHIYDSVYQEQMEIVRSKAAGELLTWNDIQKMKHTWNVVCEVMRLNPIGQGSFREAIHDFMFDGFQIPKGWKLFCSTHATQLDPEYFPEPEKFDPSRFEGNGPPPYTFMPFGGGPRMCPGKEYARLETLVFIHNLVKRFKWNTIFPNEKIIMKVTPTPAKGLPISLLPHPHTPAA